MVVPTKILSVPKLEIATYSVDFLFVVFYLIKMLVVTQLVKIVWTDAAYLLKNSLLTLAPTNISNPHF